MMPPQTARTGFAVLAEEDVGNFVQAKRQMSEQDYVNLMRAPFLPPT